MVKAAEKIETIKIRQISGLGGTATGKSDGTSKPVVNQALVSILDMALKLPALKKLGKKLGSAWKAAWTSSPAKCFPRPGGPRKKRRGSRGSKGEEAKNQWHQRRRPFYATTPPFFYPSRERVKVFWMSCSRLWTLGS